MYNKALSTIQNAVGQVAEHSYEIGMEKGFATEDGRYHADRFLQNLYNKDVCEAIAATLNTTGEIKCNQKSSEMSFDSPDFITTDGLRFWHVGGSGWTFAGGDGIDDILVDYDMTKADRKRRYENSGQEKWKDENRYGLFIVIHRDGKVSVPEPDSDDYYSYERTLVEGTSK